MQLDKQYIYNITTCFLEQLMVLLKFMFKLSKKKKVCTSKQQAYLIIDGGCTIYRTLTLVTRIHIQGHAFRLSLRKLLTLSKWQHELYEQHCSPCLANFLAGLLDLCWVFPSPTGLSVTYDHPTGVSGLMNCKPINDEQEVVFVSLSLSGLN